VNNPPSAVIDYVSVAPTSSDDVRPAVAFDGTNYFVVYQETATIDDHNIIGVFVTPAGTLGLAFPIDSSPTNDDLAPAVAFDGTNYLVVYERKVTDTDHDIWGALVDINSKIVVGPFLIDGSPSDDRAPRVAFDGTNYLVVYQRAGATDHDIVGTQVATNGSVLAGSPFVIDGSSNDDLAPQVAFDKMNFLVVYQRTYLPTDHDIIGVQVSTSGLPSAPFQINATRFDDLSPAVAFDGRNYLVVYEEVVDNSNHNILGTRVSPQGSVLGDVVFIDDSTFDDRAPHVAFDGTNYLVVYQEAGAVDHNIIGARVDPLGSVVDFITIDSSSFDDFTPVVAFGSTNYFVVYEEAEKVAPLSHNIFGALVSP